MTGLFSFHLQAPLTAASYHGQTDVVALLLQTKGVDVNKLVSIMLRIPYQISHPSAIDAYYYYLCGILISYRNLWCQPRRMATPRLWPCCWRWRELKSTEGWVSWYLPNRVLFSSFWPCSFYLQGRYGTPLQAASANGHTDIVAMLLKTKGIDVNKWVRIMLPTTSLPRPYPLLINLLLPAANPMNVCALPIYRHLRQPQQRVTLK